MHALTLLPADVITTHDGEPRTDSLKIAEAFNKQHKDVLKRLHNLDCSTEFASANFCADVQSIAIGNGAKRESKIYHMTKDGFMFLVMGFTGKKAAMIKEAFISKFNEMADALKARSRIVPAGCAPLSNHEKEAVRRAIQIVTRGDKAERMRIYRRMHSFFAVPSFEAITSEQLPDVLGFVLEQADNTPSLPPVTRQAVRPDQLPHPFESIHRDNLPDVRDWFNDYFTRHTSAENYMASKIIEAMLGQISSQSAFMDEFSVHLNRWANRRQPVDRS